MLAAGRFRKDLYYRLNVIRLHIPPLRERPEDIVPLSRHLLGKLAREADLPAPAIDADARRALTAYHWPGNVRELSSVLERTLASLTEEVVKLRDLPFHVYRRRKRRSVEKGASIRDVQHTAEKEAIVFALESCGYNKARAARRLGIHRTLLYKKMKKYAVPVQPASPT
jgi:transcriptional regulator with PAS, ATPase and Fis domain